MKKAIGSALTLGISAVFIWPASAWASSGQAIDLTSHTIGYAALAIFFLAYAFVMFEEFTHLRKSKPVILAAGILWGLVAWQYAIHDQSHLAEQAVRHNIMEYAELLLFLLVAMTYVNALEERQVFNSLKSWLVRKGFSYRKLFWVTGCLAFFISPVADNLTTALLMCAVILAVGSESPRFVGISCINIVIAANAGGAFSPFGDITTLMVWQKGILGFWDFFASADGTMCLVQSPNLINGSVDCDPIAPLIHTNAITGYTTDGTVPCQTGTCTPISVDGTTWGGVKALYR